MTKHNKEILIDDLERAIANPEALYQELNLLKVEGVAFAFGKLRAEDGAKPYTFMEYVNDPETKITERPIVIEPHTKYGRPTPLAYKVLNALLKKLSEYGVSIPDVVPFTFRELGRRIGRTAWGGKDSEEVYIAIKQLQTTAITCWGYEKETKRWANLSLNIITSILATGTKGRFSEGYVTLNPIIMGNLKRSYHRSINYARMAALDPVAMALYKQIYNVFATRQSHGQEPTFEKNYNDICAEWLGGLKSEAHRSRIIKQLGVYLEQLRQVRLLRGHEIAKNAAGEWKLKFSPGKGFKEDYEKFYRKGKQETMGFDYLAEKKKIQDPIDLVAYFYKHLYRTTATENVSVYSPKETELAKTILDSISTEDARQFIDFALAEAVTTGFDMKTFGGVRTYLPAWSAVKEKIERKQKAERERMEAEEKQVLEERYHSYKSEEIKKIRATLPPEELASLEQEIEVKLLAENPARLGLQTFVRMRTDSTLAAQYRIPTFDEWITTKND